VSTVWINANAWSMDGLLGVAGGLREDVCCGCRLWVEEVVDVNMMFKLNLLAASYSKQTNNKDARRIESCQANPPDPRWGVIT
jgi:hypothetical protein